MLDELSRYENLGTPAYFVELFTFLNGSKADWKAHEISARFFNRVIDNRGVFDGCLPLAETIGAISFNGNGTIAIHDRVSAGLVNDKYLRGILLEMILGTALLDETFHSIFCSEYTSYDIVYRLIQIDAAAFRFKYSNFRDLLLAFTFITPHPDRAIRKFIIASKFRKLFDKLILPEIKRRKVGIDELQQRLERNRLHGEAAEKWVETYEKARLQAHPSLSRVERISDYDSEAGYDVISFNDLNSVGHDRFIEVKSFVGTPSFFWSRNEMDVARLKRESYYLYLVNRDKICADYIPIVIQNPHARVLNNDLWMKRVENYYVSLSEPMAIPSLSEIGESIAGEDADHYAVPDR